MTIQHEISPSSMTKGKNRMNASNEISKMTMGVRRFVWSCENRRNKWCSEDTETFRGQVTLILARHLHRF